MRGIWVWLLLVLIAPNLLGAEEDFTVQRPVSNLSSRQRLRDTLAELLSNYLELLVEELSLASQRLMLPDRIMSDKETEEVRIRVQSLSSMRVFLHKGDVQGIILPQRALVGNVSPYVCLIGDIAHTQKEVIKALRSLLERDANSCFVACKAKAQLEKYIKKMHVFIGDVRMHIQQLDGVVRVSKKNR